MNNLRKGDDNDDDDDDDDEKIVRGATPKIRGI